MKTKNEGKRVFNNLDDAVEYFDKLISNPYMRIIENEDLSEDGDCFRSVLASNYGDEIVRIYMLMQVFTGYVVFTKHVLL